MLTDIFAERYRDQTIWTTLSDVEQRLLVQLFQIVKEALPYYTDGKEDEERAEKWRQLHDLLARELGVDELSPRYYPATQWVSEGVANRISLAGYITWEFVCERFVKASGMVAADPDRFVKERISFIELAMRQRGKDVAEANEKLPSQLKQAAVKDAAMGRGPRIPGSAVDALKSINRKLNAAYEQEIAEINERFKRAKVSLTYHNGLIQFATDEVIEQEVAKPFWDLVSDPRWENVDKDMKAALDQRDSGGKDPAFFASKALESAIKIISFEKGWTTGKEKGPGNYIDHLMCKKNGFIAIWEGEMLIQYFGKVRNEVGHGPGPNPMPELNPEQTDWAIESAMSWIRSLVRRM